MVYNFFVFLIVFAALLMIRIVLIPDSNGGRPASHFS